MSNFKSEILLVIVALLMFAVFIVFNNTFFKPATEEVGTSYLDAAKTAIPSANINNSGE